ncbi:MAG TPA: hypothetical protein VFR77_06480 [Steroidobacteraceae bacterium]|nr:hypothetical protein [Steroidobacteraceae bacterium]
MFTMVAQSTRKTFSAVAAVAIVSFGGLVMDQAYLAAAPKGTVEIGELTALGDAGATLAQLPEVVVLAKRQSATYFAATQLPEIVVVAKRVATLVAKDGDKQHAASPAIHAGF